MSAPVHFRITTPSGHAAVVTLRDPDSCNVEEAGRAIAAARYGIPPDAVSEARWMSELNLVYAALHDRSVRREVT